MTWKIYEGHRHLSWHIVSKKGMYLTNVSQRDKKMNSRRIGAEIRIQWYLIRYSIRRAMTFKEWHF